MAKNEAKIKFTAETGDFNNSIKQSKDQMSLLNAQMKLNDTQMKATGTTVDGLKKKQEILTAQQEEQQNVVNALNGKLQKAAECFGENSSEATKLRTQLANAQNAEEKISQAIDKCNKELAEQADVAGDVEVATDGTETAIEKLSGTIDEQQAELNELKNEYKSAVLEHGKFSKEARTLAKDIKALSGDLDGNSKKMSELDAAADKLDESLDNVDVAAEKVSEGFTVMKGTMASLAAEGIMAVVDGLKEISTQAFNSANSMDVAMNTFAAKTGASTERVEELGAVMENIYKNNYGESFEDIANAMAEIEQQAGDFEFPADGLEILTTQALILRDTFDMDVSESFRAANMLMEQFGLDGERAYELIAQGAQSGLNKNGDLLDIINEYSVHFREAGYSSEQMFNMLANGASTGVFSVDKLGDAVKEFNIRMSDGSAKEAVEALGFSWEKVSADWSKGGEDAAAVLNMLMTEMAGLENTTDGYSIGVGLMGTMFEDLGYDAVAALSNTQGEISLTGDVLEGINSIKYDDLGSSIEGIKRNLELSVIGPIQDQVMPAVNEFVEDVDWEGVGETVGEVFGTIVDGAFAIVNGVKEVVTWMKEHKAIVIAVASVVGILTTAITAYNVVNGIKAAMEAANVTTVWALVSAHIAQAAAAMAAIAPYVLIVAAIAAVIAIIVLCIKHWDKIVAAVKKAWEKIKAALAAVGQWIYNNVILPVVNFFTGLWSTIVNGVTAAWTWVTGLLSSVGQWIYNNVIAPVVNFFTGLWNSIVEAYHTVIDPWIEIFRRAAAWVDENVIQPVVSFFTGLWESIKEIFLVVSTWFDENVIQPVVNFFRGLWEDISGFFSDLWNDIKEVWNKVSTWFSDNVTGPVKEKFTQIWSSIKNGASKAWQGIKDTFSSVATWFKDVFSKAWQGVKDVFSTGGKIFDGIKEGIADVFKTVVNGIIGGINKVIKVPFDGINSALSKIKNISILDVEPFDWIQTISVPQIPLLAEGGILTGPTLNIAGEAGPEAIIPIEKLQSFMNGALERSFARDNISQLVAAVEDLANRPIEMSINGQKFAVATAADTDTVNGGRIALRQRGLAL